MTAHIRQALVGGHYALLNATTFAPRPDFYAAVLFRRLIDGRALASGGGDAPHFRSWGFCAKPSAAWPPGSVAWVVVNAEKRPSPMVRFGSARRHEFVLAGAAERGRRPWYSRRAELNGAVLGAPARDGALRLEPRVVADGSPLSLAPVTYAFVVVEPPPAGGPCAPPR